MIALIGSDGSMGTRYQAIFNHLNENYVPLDRSRHSEESILSQAAAADRILICTPTHTHLHYLRNLLPTRKPILCEKPVTKDLEALRDLHLFCSRGGFTYQMVMQYKELALADTVGRWSSYNYFRHGNDGLAWDCTQTIALANGPVELKETSPVWECVINGQALNIRDMDWAYVSMIKRWLKDELTMTMDEILKIHEKVANYIEMMNENT